MPHRRNCGIHTGGVDGAGEKLDVIEVHEVGLDPLQGLTDGEVIVPGLVQELELVPGGPALRPLLRIGLVEDKRGVNRDTVLRALRQASRGQKLHLMPAGKEAFGDNLSHRSSAATVRGKRVGFADHEDLHEGISVALKRSRKHGAPDSGGLASLLRSRTSQENPQRTVAVHQVQVGVAGGMSR